MPRLIDPGAGGAIALGEVVEALVDNPVDIRDEDAFAALGPLLARLGRNRSFLADLAIAELKDRCRGQATTNGYGPQVFMLAPPRGGYVLRANFWPAADDWALRASGRAAFFYDMPHDHNFPFLTVGYLGPGYWSDYYEVDIERFAGLAGEPAHLRFVERSRLETGKLMLYRMRRDVHAQLPPDSFSVSLNILGYDAAQPWLDQYRFDIARDCVGEGLTVAPSEALVAMAVHLGGGNGIDLAEQFAARHPSDRMRATALDALAGRLERDARADRYAAAAGDASAYIAGHARARLDRLMAPERT